MKSTFNVIIIKHSVDGLKIALREQPAEGKPHLTIVVSGGPGCAFAYGFVTPAEYTGFIGLLHYAPSHVATEVEMDGRRFPVVFPAGQSVSFTEHAEFLDRIRTRLSDWAQVNLVIDYRRLDLDLPPLQATDQVACFWEIRDMLTDHDVTQFKYLSERLVNDGPIFDGLLLYTRGQAPENAMTRQQEIEEAAQITATRPLLRI